MAEEIKVIISADVQQGINNIGKFNAKLGDTDDIVSDVIGTSKNLEDALDKLGRQGLLSINSLQGSINDFKAGFAAATDPEDIKKFGDALVVLQKRQQSLIDAGLPESLEKVGHSASGNVQPIQRLSTSFLGLSKIFDILPQEVAHLTHNFEGIVQSFERVGHGSESTSEKVTKFAGVLGQVGLGLAISVAVGLLVDFVHGLFDTSEALKEVELEGAKFSNAIRKINESIEDSKANIEFLKKLNDITIDINFGKGFEADLLQLQRASVAGREQASKLADSFDEASKLNSEAFERMSIGLSDGARELKNSFASLADIPTSLLSELSKQDQAIISNAKQTSEEILKIAKEQDKNAQDQIITYRQIAQLRINEQRKKEKELNDELRASFESRQNIIKEFTAKFASIKDPFPDFFTKNLPLGKVEDKALRAALENAFKALEQASRDLFNTNKIDPGTIPIEIKFKPEIADKSDLVRQIEEKFGDISKEVADAVNKGIFEVPVDFRIAPEGDGQALEELNKDIDGFLKSIQSLTGQRNPRLDISPEFLVTLDKTKVRDTINKLSDEISVIAAGSHPEIKIDATGKVFFKLNQEEIGKDLARQINEIFVQVAGDSAIALGESLGDALSGKNSDITDAFKSILNVIAGGIDSIGKALIKAGVIASGIGKAIKAFAIGHPGIAIALGIAMVALARGLQNSLANSAREKGGPVAAGISYLVNEKGKEIFQPNTGSPYWIEGGPQIFKPKTSGKIIPAPLTASFAKMFADRFNMPKFETGGLISGPVFGLLGEGSSISSINPEVIAPLETLKNLLPGFNGQSVDVRVSGQIRNRVIALGQNREARSNRRTG